MNDGSAKLTLNDIIPNDFKFSDIFYDQDKLGPIIGFELGEQLASQLPYIYVAIIMCLFVIEKRYLNMTKIYQRRMVGLMGLKLLLYGPFFLSAGLVKTILLLLTVDAITYAVHDLINYYFFVIPYGIHVFIVILKNLKILNESAYHIASFFTRNSVEWAHTLFTDILIKLADSSEIFNRRIQHPLVFCITMGAMFAFFYCVASTYYCPTPDIYIMRPKGRVRIYANKVDDVSEIRPVWAIDSSCSSRSRTSSDSSSCIVLQFPYQADSDFDFS